MSASRTMRRVFAWLLLIATPLTPITLPLPGGWAAFGEALAQQGNKPALALIPLARREGVKTLAAARIEEYLRAMIEAGGVVTLIPEDVVSTGRPRRKTRRAKTPQQTEAQKQLDKADEALIAGRDGLQAGDDLATAFRLLEAAIARYEEHFVELVDFTKLVDAYARAAEAALKLGKKREAKALVTKALTIQPTFVLDNVRSYPELVELLKETRERLTKRRAGDIEVSANVEGAVVFVDGVRLGEAPAEAKDLLPGTHYVQVKKDNAEPWGRAVTVRGRTVKVAAKLEVEEDEGSEIALAVRYTDIKPIPEKGEYHTKLVRNFSFMFARQIQAQYLLYGVLATTMRGIELHLFLFDFKARKVAALQPVEFASNLGNMQMKILEAEGYVRAAVASFPADRVVADVPEVYTRTAAAPSRPAVVAPPPVVVAPDPKPDPRPDPRPDPQPDPDPRPDPEPRPTSPVVTGPQTKPNTPIKPKTDPYAGLVKDEDESVVKKWWFWTVLGVVAAGGGAAAYYMLSQEPAASPNFKVDAVIAP
ncbi:MAG: PEGA domain-containing protein [Deltaproteobacteria bacterium]|nr:PEGA domain-containing protein [Deltaproteobacteria bacterium]